MSQDILGLDIERTVWNDKFSESSDTPNVKKAIHNTVQCVVIITTLLFGSFMNIVRTALLGPEKEHEEHVEMVATEMDENDHTKNLIS